jgi:hypothetical protein
MQPVRARGAPLGAVALLLGLAFGAFFAAISRGVFLYGDDVLMYQVTESLVERGEFTVTSTAPARTNAHAIVGADGRRYAKYGIAQSLAAVPFFAVAGPLFDRFELPESRDSYGNLRTGAEVFGTGLTNAAIGGAAVACAFLLAIELGAGLGASFAGALLLGFATLWPHYSATFLSEPLAGLCLSLGLLAMEKAKAHTMGGWAERRWLAISGFAAGAAVATKVALIAVVWPLAALALIRSARSKRGRSRIESPLCWSFSFFFWLAAILAFNSSRFGSPWQTGYGGEASRFETPLLEGLAGLLVSPVKGLLWYSPVVILAAVGFARIWRRDRGAALAIGAMSAAHLLITSKFYQWYGGGAWGPRLLVPMLPVWMAVAALALARLRARSLPRRAGVVALVCAGLLATAAGIAVPFDRDLALVVDSPRAMKQVAWETERSPLLVQLRELPQAVPLAVAKLFAFSGDLATGAGLAKAGVPDVAFARYGSHALLSWTRGALLLSLVLFVAATLVAKRAQKALLSRPPQ